MRRLIIASSALATASIGYACKAAAADAPTDAPSDSSAADGPTASSVSSSSSMQPGRHLEHLWQPPTFSAAAVSKFDMSVYAGRALHYLDVLGDLSMLTVTQEQCDDSARTLQAHRRGEAAELDDATLWRARKVLDACVHPETGELIPAPFRFSAFAPANLVICGGLLWASGHTLRASAFWQWLNQSYNVGVNHCNRSSTSPSTERLVAAYSAATLSSVTLAIGLQHLGSRLHGSARLVQLTVPMVGVAVGAVVNLLMTRGGELTDGITVSDDQGSELGRSCLAAQTALAQCSATRVAWTVALLTLAPIVSGLALRALPASLPSAASVVVDLGASFAVIWLSVPLCIAIFPQHTSLPGAELEAPFHAHARVLFNKGL